MNQTRVLVQKIENHIQVTVSRLRADSGAALWSVAVATMRAAVSAVLPAAAGDGLHAANGEDLAALWAAAGAFARCGCGLRACAACGLLPARNYGLRAAGSVQCGTAGSGRRGSAEPHSASGSGGGGGSGVVARRCGLRQARRQGLRAAVHWALLCAAGGSRLCAAGSGPLLKSAQAYCHRADSALSSRGGLHVCTMRKPWGYYYWGCLSAQCAAARQLLAARRLEGLEFSLFLLSIIEGYVAIKQGN